MRKFSWINRISFSIFGLVLLLNKTLSYKFNTYTKIHLNTIILLIAPLKSYKCFFILSCSRFKQLGIFLPVIKEQSLRFSRFIQDSFSFILFSFCFLLFIIFTSKNTKKYRLFSIDWINIWRRKKWCLKYVWLLENPNEIPKISVEIRGSTIFVWLFWFHFYFEFQFSIFFSFWK